jgi:hypothetical protein
MLEQMRSHLSQFGDALRSGTLPPQEKRKIIESLVAEVRVRRAAYRGRALTPVAIQQTIPFREDIPKEPEQAIRETLWSRDPQPQPEEPPKESVQIVYRFPFPPGERDLLRFANTPDLTNSGLMGNNPQPHASSACGQRFNVIGSS